MHFLSFVGTVVARANYQPTVNLIVSAFPPIDALLQLNTSLRNDELVIRTFVERDSDIKIYVLLSMDTIKCFDKWVNPTAKLKKNPQQAMIYRYLTIMDKNAINFYSNQFESVLLNKESLLYFCSCIWYIYRSQRPKQMSEGIPLGIKTQSAYTSVWNFIYRTCWRQHWSNRVQILWLVLTKYIPSKPYIL